MAHRNETFGRLLKGAISSIATYEGKTIPTIEEDLGAQIGISSAMVERYKGGQVPVEPERTKVLAEAAVRRGYQNREWLQRFLNAARYHATDQLLDQITPLGPARPRPPRMYENLPAPTYSQFVMRDQAFADVLDGLQQRSAVILIVGLGGNGKTSLAREVAGVCLKAPDAIQGFDGIVWVSDKDQPGTTNLSIVLDEIARTLDYPGFTQFEYEEKRREVEQLLRRQRVLLVVDNFETVTDGSLLTWLLRLPEPSKAIVTTREYRRELRSSWPIELRGMSEGEAQTLINQRLRFLRMEHLVNDLTQLEPLVTVTGGNPKAIGIALGLVKHERRPLQQVVDDLHAARGELFDDLFARAWSLLDEAARRVLLAMTFFPTSANSEALAATADVQGYSFERAVERLTDLALLDVQQIDLASAVRYTVHPLVRVFAETQCIKQTEFEKGARKRWMEWAEDLVMQVGHCWDDMSKLNLLDADQETIFYVMSWTLQHGYCQHTIRLARETQFYYYIRGFWNKKQSLEWFRVQAAHQITDTIEEAKSLSYYVQMLSRRGEIDEVSQHLPLLHHFQQSVALPPDTRFHIHHAFGLYWLAQRKFDEALSEWQQVFAYIDTISSVSAIATRQWIATCQFHLGNLTESKQLFERTLEDAVTVNYQRAITYSRFRLAAIHLELNSLDLAKEELDTALLQSYQYQDRRNIAEIQRLYARLHTLRNDLPAARTALTEAIDLFERLGMRRELAEARQALADLDAGAVPV